MIAFLLLACLRRWFNFIYNNIVILAIVASAFPISISYKEALSCLLLKQRFAVLPNFWNAAVRVCILFPCRTVPHFYFYYMEGMESHKCKVEYTNNGFYRGIISSAKDSILDRCVKEDVLGSLEGISIS